MAGRFEGKVALITGAARGQGRSHAVRLAEEGADIIALDICRQISSVPYPMSTLEDLQTTAAAVEGIGRRVVAAQVDVRDLTALTAAVDRAVGTLGRLDLVSANAGILSVGTLDQLAPQAWRDTIDTNLTGVWHTTRACIPHILAGGRGGAIVITSSVGGMRPYAASGHYVSAKHGLVGLTRTLALELAPHSIRVNCIHPPQVDTEMIMNDVVWKLFCPDKDTPTLEDFAAVNRQLNALPVPWVEPVDISNALVFLASDEARYITGISLPVDAGAMLK
jgi:(+)-trans-carveol dehydrogenase